MRTHVFDLVIYAVAVLLLVLAYLRDPGLPAIGIRAGLWLLVDILPRLLAAMLRAYGMTETEMRQLMTGSAKEMLTTLA